MSLRVRAILALLPLLATALLALTIAAPWGAWAADLTLVHSPSSETGGSSAREWRWERAEREAGPEPERVRSALKGSHDACARQYSPQLRKWVAPDPLVYADSLDRWLFNVGDPIQFIDPWCRDSRPPNEETGGAGDGDRDRGGWFSRWLEGIRNGGDGGGGPPDREPTWEPMCEWGCGSAGARAMEGAPEHPVLFGPLQPFVQVYDYISDEYSQLQVGPLLGNLTPVDLSLSHEIAGETDRALDTLEWIGAIASVGLGTGPAGVGEIGSGGTSTAISSYWPANNGFLGQSTRAVLQAGQRIDRYGGSAFSRFFSPTGTPLGARAIPPETANQALRTFEVLKPLEVEAGTVAPAFGQLGLGTQYRTSMTLSELVEQGFLKEILP